MTGDPQPFPASAQYLTQSMDDPGDDEPEEQAKMPKKRGKRARKKAVSRRKACLSRARKTQKASSARPERPQAPAPGYVPGEFCAARDRFVSRARQLLKVDYRTASELWNRSNEKKTYLKHMPLPELKRRRFVPKGATCNPFA